MKYSFGIDVGGTTVKCGLFDNGLSLLEKWELITDKSEQGKHIPGDIAASVAEKIKERNLSAADIAGIGIGVPGPVLNQSVVRRCVNLGWGVFDARAAFEKELEAVLKVKLPVFIENDANVAALGEALKGSGSSYKSLVMITLGTGVGGGVIIDGRIISGAGGAAGEIGHMTVLYDEQESCNCGKKGCLEQIASATGIVRYARRLLHETTEPSVLRKSGADDTLSAKEVFEASAGGDIIADRVVNTVCDYLALAISHITCIVNPEAVVLGGGVSKAGQVLIDTVSQYYKKRAFAGCRDTDIIRAVLGNDAGIYGAAALVGTPEA